MSNITKSTTLAMIESTNTIRQRIRHTLVFVGGRGGDGGGGAPKPEIGTSGCGGGTDGPDK
ncbi:MAG: hypothetical protein JSW47_08430 [Phycisphaerales bacterium]|nr:MAG: hypothetical protein JSW47_08430 [Phycisphaerales bacterium]